MKFLFEITYVCLPIYHSRVLQSQKKIHFSSCMTKNKNKKKKHTKRYFGSHPSRVWFVVVLLDFSSFYFSRLFKIYFNIHPLIPTKMNHFYTRKDYFIGIFFILRYKFCVFFTQFFFSLYFLIKHFPFV